MRQRFNNFMMGRYGPDHLYVALFAVGITIGIFGRVLRWPFLVYAGYLPLGFAVYRFFSRNITKRRAENDRFLYFWAPVRYRLKNFKDRMKSSKTHRFFKCPNCKNMLRVPKGKGKIQITCPKCGERFEKRS